MRFLLTIILCGLATILSLVSLILTVIAGVAP